MHAQIRLVCACAALASGALILTGSSTALSPANPGPTLGARSAAEVDQVTSAAARVRAARIEADRARDRSAGFALALARTLREQSDLTSSSSLHRDGGHQGGGGNQPKQLCDGHRATIVGTEGDDTIQGTIGRDVIVALGGNDTIHSLDQNDIICAGAGDDWIWAGAGNDTIFGGDGHDFLVGGPGNDTMDGGNGTFDAVGFFDETGPVQASLVTGTASGEGRDTFTNAEELHGGDYADTFTGDDGDNGFFGNGGNDRIFGGGGNDNLNGGDGNDTLDGGAGNDSIGFWGATGPVTASLVTGTSSGQGSDTFVGAESLNGGPYADTLIGDGGDNWLSGNEGNDVLSGGGGNDFLDGGSGDDTMDGGVGTFDAVAFFDETGPVTASLVTGTASGAGNDTFTNAEQLHGGDYADTFTGNDGDNGFFGNGGNDTISGGGGNDNLNGGDGDDTLDGGAGASDSVGFWGASGSIAASLVTGTSTGQGSDTFVNVEGLNGAGFDDVLTGDGGDNFLSGDAGNDTLNGGGGHDFLVGGPGDDTMDGGAGANDAVGFFNETAPVTASLVSGTATGEGSDSFTNIEELHGGNYGDTLIGNDGDNGFFGNGGNDTISGGGGNDNLNGGEGNDTIDGGPGTFDIVGFWGATGPIAASLVTGTSTGQGSDTLVNVEDLYGASFDDVLTGDAGDNNLFGDAGNDTLNGGDGNDLLNGGSGNDTLDGGNGDSDGAAFWNATGPVVASFATGTSTGDGSDTFVNVEQLHGGDYGDTLSAGAGNAWIFGNGGDDTITGGAGDDFLFGGVGDDTIAAGAGNDFLAPGSGIDALDGGAGSNDNAAYWDETGPITANLAGGTATGDGTDSLQNIEGLNGGGFDDNLTGDAGDNSLFGDAGSDTLNGAGGNDSLNGWNGDDTLAGGSGNDYLDGAAGNDSGDGGVGWDYCVNIETLVNCEQPSPSPSPSLVFDNFDDNTLDTASWFPVTNGVGPHVQVTGGRVQIDLPATSIEAGQGVFSAGINGTCPLRGDFDMQVDYSLPVWPLGNGVRVGLATGYKIVERTADNGIPDNYLLDMGGSVLGFTPTSDLQGTLRMARHGTTLFGYYKSASGWTLIATAPTDLSDVAYAIQAWSGDAAFGHSDVEVTFDNFHVTAGTRVC